MRAIHATFEHDLARVGQALRETGRKRRNVLLHDAVHSTPSYNFGFAVGHWWQGRLVEGVGLMALFFGGFWLADARK